MTQKSYQSKKTIQRSGYLSLLLIYALIASIFFVAGGSLLTFWDAGWSAQVLMYMVFVSLFLAIYEKIPPDFKKPISESFIGFIVAFILGGCILIIAKEFGLPMLQNIAPLPVHMVFSSIVFFIVIVAVSEEIIFRGAILYAIRMIILQFLKRKDVQRGSLQWEHFAQKNYGILIVAIVIQAIIFSIYHITKYGSSLDAMFQLVLLGTLFGGLAIFVNMGAAIGAHAIWDCFAGGAMFAT